MNPICCESENERSHVRPEERTVGSGRNLDVLQLEEFWHVIVLNHFEQRAHNVQCTEALVPKMRQQVHCPINLSVQTRFDNVFANGWMWLIANLEDVLGIDKAKSGISGL